MQPHPIQRRNTMREAPSKKTPEKEAEKQLDTKLVQALNKAYKELFKEESPKDNDPIAKLHRLLELPTKLQQRLADQEKERQAIAEALKREQQRNAEVGGQLKVETQRELAYKQEIDKLKRQLARAERLFEQSQQKQDDHLNLLEANIRGPDEWSSLKIEHDRLRQEHEDFVKRHEEEKAQWEEAKKMYEEHFARYRHPERANATSSDIENDVALETYWDEAGLEQKQLTLPFDACEHQQLKSCPESHRQLESRMGATERALQYAEANNRKLQLQLEESSSLKLESARVSMELHQARLQLAEYSNMKRELVHLSEELGLARATAKELKDRVEKLGSELKDKETEILRQKDKKNLYKVSSIQYKSKLEELKEMHNHMLEITEERVRKEYETPDRYGISRSGTPNVIMSEQNTPNISPSNSRNRSNMKVRPELSIQVSMTPTDRSPERSPPPERSPEPEKIQYRIGRYSRDEQSEPRPSKIPRVGDSAVLKEYSDQEAQTQQGIREYTPIPERFEPLAFESQESPKKNMGFEKRVLAVDVQPHRRQEPLAKEQTIKEVQTEHAVPQPNSEREIQTDPERREKNQQQTVVHASKEVGEQHCQTEQMLTDQAASRIDYQTPAKQLNQEATEQLRELRIEIMSVHAELQKAQELLDEARTDLQAQRCRNAQCVSSHIRASEQQRAQMEATIQLLEIELKDQREANRSLVQGSHLPEQFEKLVTRKPSLHEQDSQVKELTALVESLSKVNVIQEKKLASNRELLGKAYALFSQQSQLNKFCRFENVRLSRDIVELKNLHASSIKELSRMWLQCNQTHEHRQKQQGDQATKERKDLELRLEASEQARELIDSFSKAAYTVDLTLQQLEAAQQQKKQQELDHKLVRLLEILLEGVVSKAQFSSRQRSIDKIKALRRSTSRADKSNILNELLVDLTTFTGKLIDL